MWICAIAILIFIAITRTKFYKKIDNIKKYFIIFYFFWWIIWTGIASTDYGNTFPIKTSTILIFVSATIAFIVGFIMMDIIKYIKQPQNIELQKQADIKENNKIKEEKKFDKIFLITQLSILIVLIYYKVKQLTIINQYGTEIKRLMTFKIGYLFNSTIEAGLFNYFLSAIIVIFTIITLNKVATKKVDLKHFFTVNNIIIIIQLVINILLFEINYSRLIFWTMIIYFVIWLIILHANDMNIFLKENSKWIIKLVISMFILLIISSLFRVGIDISNPNTIVEAISKTTNQFVIYFTGGQKAFEKAVQENYRDDIIKKYRRSNKRISNIPMYRSNNK